MSKPDDFPDQNSAVSQPPQGDDEEGAWHFTPDPEFDFNEMFPPDLRTPEEIAASEAADTYAQLYANGVTTISELDEEYLGVTQAGMDAWYAGLSSEDRQQLEAETQAYQENLGAMAEIRERLAATAPELLEGHLPEAQAALLPQHYVLGTNQSGCYTPEDAQEYLGEYDGISVTMYNLNNRFLFFDDSETLDTTREHALTAGYYGPVSGGKFVIAVPLSDKSWRNYRGEDINSVPDIAYGEGVLPEDYKTHGEGDESSVNAKYCAGFIDAVGAYRPNANFMVSTVPAITPTSPEHSEEV